MTCKDAIDKLSEYLDAELSHADLSEYETHLGRCSACRSYLATYRRTTELVAKVNRVAITERLRTRLRELLTAT